MIMMIMIPIDQDYYESKPCDTLKELLNGCLFMFIPEGQRVLTHPTPNPRIGQFKGNIGKTNI